MDSGVSGPTQGMPVYCATCGRPISAGLTACPNCGAPVVQGGGPAASPEFTSGMTVPSGPTWQATPAVADSQVPTWQTPAMPQGAPQPKRGRRTLLMGGIAGVLVVALLATGVAYVLGAFNQHNELDAAKYLPGNTIFFSGVDVYSLAENSHNISLNTLVQNSGGGSVTAGTGLDWTNDVLPWLGRVVAAGAIPQAGATTGSGVGGAALIQSHDDAKAQAAMKKAADHFGSVTTSSYNGFALYTQAAPSDGTSVATGATFTAGKGWAVIASDLATAKLVIDRINGTGDTLASQQGFQQATDNLPSNRFGTVYADLNAIGALANVDETPQVKQLIDTYPVGVGYTSWTSAGLHAQISLNAKNGGGTTYPAGDAAALASAVPAGAYAYISIGNVGGDLAVAAKQAGSDSAASIEKALGVPLTSPALQQPAAIAVFPNSTSGATGTPLPGEALLLKAPDASAASSFLQSFATANSCTLGTSDVDPSAQTLSCPFSLSGINLTGTSDDTFTDPSTPTLPILVKQANGVMIFALDATSMQAITSTLSGGASLAQASTFKSLLSAAPSGAQTLAYVDVSALINVFGAITSSSGLGTGASTTPTATPSPFQPTAVLIAAVSDSSKTQVSIDVALK